MLIYIKGTFDVGSFDHKKTSQQCRFVDFEGFTLIGNLSQGKMTKSLDMSELFIQKILPEEYLMFECFGFYQRKGIFSFFLSQLRSRRLIIKIGSNLFLSYKIDLSPLYNNCHSKAPHHYISQQCMRSYICSKLLSPQRLASTQYTDYARILHETKTAEKSKKKKNGQ